MSIKKQSIPNGTRVRFSLKDVSCESFDGQIRAASAADGKLGTVLCLATATKLGEKDYEYYDVKMDHGAALSAVSGYNLDLVEKAATDEMVRLVLDPEDADELLEILDAYEEEELGSVSPTIDKIRSLINAELNSLEVKHNQMQIQKLQQEVAVLKEELKIKESTRVSQIQSLQAALADARRGLPANYEFVDPSKKKQSTKKR